jgi:hypothetical protein
MAQCQFFITKRGDLTCPQTKFREDLIPHPKRWHEEGDQLLVCLDTNEHVQKKSIETAVTDIEGLAMEEVVGEFKNQPIRTNILGGFTPIDEVWATSDILVGNGAIMPAG